MTARSFTRTQGADTLRAPAPADEPLHYVRIPQRLLTAAAYHPLQVGVYSLVARLYLVAQMPVPLSAADVVRYDPSLSRGAVQRALTRLVDDGWLLANDQLGQKTRYAPTWGRVLGEPLPWRIGASRLGRPGHVSAVRLDLRLLDTYLGKLIPHPQRAAIITRYVTAPLLTLADVGAYGHALGGLPGSTPRLVAWGLIRNEQPLPLPDDVTILEQASQGPLHEKDGPTLTVRGLQRAGLTARNRPPASSQQLFFVPRDLIGEVSRDLLTNVIDSTDDVEEDFVPSQRHISEVATTAAEITWDSHGKNRDEIPPPPPPMDGGGGEHQVHEHGPALAPRRKRRTQRHDVGQSNRSIRETETTRALRAINVLPDQVAELADIPIEVVAAAIRDGQARPYVRDLAAWVVALVRTHRDHGWTITPPAPAADSPEALGACFARLAAEQATEARDQQDHSPDEASGVASAEDGSAPPHADDAAALDRAARAPGALWNDALEILRLRLPRRDLRDYFQGAALLGIADGCATIGVAGARSKAGLELRYSWVLRDVLGELVGEPLLVRFVIAASLPKPTTAATHA